MILAESRKRGANRSSGRRRGSGGSARRIVRARHDARSPRGTMRLAPNGAEHAFSAAQTLEVRQIGFAWRARMPLAGPVVAYVAEGLDRGEGYLTVKLFGLVPLARARAGDAAFRGEALRYLAELAWNPDAVLFNRELDWRVVDQDTLLVGAGGDAPRRDPPPPRRQRRSRGDRGGWASANGGAPDAANAVVRPLQRLRVAGRSAHPDPRRSRMAARGRAFRLLARSDRELVGRVAPGNSAAGMVSADLDRVISVSCRRRNAWGVRPIAHLGHVRHRAPPATVRLLLP